MAARKTSSSSTCARSRSSSAERAPAAYEVRRDFLGSVGTADDWFAVIGDGFDTLYAEGAEMPKMMSVGLHMRLIGLPARAAGLARLLDHIACHDRVWITGRLDIARHWIATHPYTGAGLNE